MYGYNSASLNMYGPFHVKSNSNTVYMLKQ
jgi:hypothetical protein